MKKSKKNKAIRATIIASVIIAAGLVLASCLTGRFGFDGSLTTPTDTIRISDHPKASVTISVEP